MDDQVSEWSGVYVWSGGWVVRCVGGQVSGWSGVGGQVCWWSGEWVVRCVGGQVCGWSGVWVIR